MRRSLSEIDYRCIKNICDNNYNKNENRSISGTIRVLSYISGVYVLVLTSAIKFTISCLNVIELYEWFVGQLEKRISHCPASNSPSSCSISFHNYRGTWKSKSLMFFKFQSSNIRIISLWNFAKFSILSF